MRAVPIIERVSSPWLDENDVQLWHGDALQVLRHLPDSSVDAVIADPPYSSGGTMRSDRNLSTRNKYVQKDVKHDLPDFVGDSRDQRSYLAWATLWLAECWRVVKPGRACMVFTDWRQLPTTTDALQAGGFVWRGVVPCEKPHPRPAPGFAASAEYVVWGTRGPTDFGHSVHLPGRVVGQTPRDREHITQKPIGWIEHLLGVVEPGGTVLDPFAGSGTTLVAARARGFRAIGIEIDKAFVDMTTRRLAQGSLFAAGETENEESEIR